MAVQRRIRGGQVRWVARYRGPDGKERSKTFDAKKAAKDWVNDREKDVRQGDWVDPDLGRITVGEVARRWESLAGKDGTRANRHYLTQQLGRLEDTPVALLRTPHINEWVSELTAGRPWADNEPVKVSTIRTLCAQLSGALHLAVEEGMIAKTPRIPRPPKPPQSISRSELVTVGEVRALAEAARTGISGTRPGRGVRPSPTLARMILAAAGTGLRPGELAGLRVRSVDFLRREISVVEQAGILATDDRRPLKTRASRRLVPFGNSVLEVMSEELRENPVDTSNESVFRSARGLLWTSGTISNTFLRLREHLGLDEHVTFKSLRHFYASTLIASGASVTMVAEYLGHASPAITLEVYAHLWPGDDDRARQAVDAVALLSDDGAGPVRDRAGRLALA
ncbi:tyrosine-type recombinase/integrase [Rhodococcus hoagii]|uniref:Tyrosine-type recombinase/integrase n=1 Tax=Rhodococcus hoagii TaxID=43767 RepID=A0A9Q2S874_RHOHA|nr:site-specific integrase [Prescottella equi]MBM4498216.1 tyrosine-type recombinase/integrase [Prescottella equi]MBM4498595.1 tyrosine-type recombinase/integrase [Prescottella equi]MBM4567619.1 tyrosine-type recombinase/integrase [Prescottella equi]MCU7530686.1 site-specific integrase [Prescottella equi]MCU7536160.1 site-specific integrase [Prescottella equi]